FLHAESPCIYITRKFYFWQQLFCGRITHAALIYNWILNTTFEGTVKLINGESFQDEFVKPSWLDTTLPCVIQLLNHWTYFFDGKNFDVVHDASWVLKKENGLLIN